MGCSAAAPTSTSHLSPGHPSATPTLDVTALDPCSLLAADTLAAVHGWAPGTPVRTDPPGGGASACRVDLGGGRTLTAMVLPRAIAPGEGEKFIDSLPPDPDSELHGFGDVAWFGHCDGCPPGTTTSLTTAAAPLEFTLALTDTTPSGTQRLVLESLARGIVERLGL